MTFRRSVAVDDWADLRIHLEAKSVRPAPPTARSLILAATLGVFALFGALAKRTVSSVGSRAA
jgi:hypothetical protein